MTAMTKSEHIILSQVQEANHQAERAYWWMKEIDREEARRLGLTGMVQSVLALLNHVDDITVDIGIAIKDKTRRPANNYVNPNKEI